MNLLKRNILLIGIGNEFRNDDAAGLHVARRLKNYLPEDVEVIETSGEGAALLELWKSSDKVFAVDAVNSGNKAGRIYRFDGLSEILPAKFFNYSSHSFSITEAVEVGRKLNQLPCQFIIYGIEGKNFEQGIGLSKEVEDAIDIVTQKIGDEVLGSK
jgi:hydrogenase maturation protease